MLTTCPNCLHVFHNSACCEQQQQQPLTLSLTLPPATTCTVSVTTSQRVMAGGGIVKEDKMVIPSCSPQPSPSTPLSFILPTSTRTPSLLPFQWTMPQPAATGASYQWPTTGPWVLGLQLPASQSTPQVSQSDTDLVRLAATLKALRTSGWYYEGLSWQESAEALHSTSPGTFLVRDSSDPKFLFSLSVQTDRGPTSVRLHYVCGQFRLDAESRLAPQMPLFDCVVRLVEYYIEATKDGAKHSKARRKEQVWVDANGQVYSHILLTTPLYKKQHPSSLQHLARLAINKSFKSCSLPLPALLTDYLKQYPYSH